MSKTITLSRTFPTYHPKEGQPTYFVEAILNQINADRHDFSWRNNNYIQVLSKVINGSDKRVTSSGLTGSNPFVYSFDLNGYGSMQFPEQNVFCIAGFSEKIFSVMELLEKDKKALINEIHNVVI